ncbi:ABC transporter ATP-binding protein [Parenemella sanctibonifatiensis]|uniref:ABC transporter ATP-binding protein n=1 Tax=Parenemella sanctibonifatiensis TaxID=2016505 RepID=UPI001E285DC5|nr:ABC transporter ATP-binding protein [Parenemella sanctibonifatiensis]
METAGPERTDLAVKVEQLSITYRTTLEKRPTFKQALIRMSRGQRAIKEIEAIKDLSFEVKRGTTMGIIGHNGAGKSTLLRAMSGILPPTSGQVEVWGKVSTLLALGVGFNSALSGRENIVLGALASGLTRSEVDERAEEIAAWTELGDFIDAPMRTYSSGMTARVGFAVGVHMDPDIFMVDEALSAGDAYFRDKANAKMEELRHQARAMFVVSHGLQSIKAMCDEVLWLDHGQFRGRGKPEEMIDAYMEASKVKESPATTEEI